MRNKTCNILTAVVAVILLPGCQPQSRHLIQEQPEAPHQQQARLRAAEDADLQRQLAAREAEIETLRQKHAQELRVRDQELIRCKVRIGKLEQDLQKGIDERIQSVTAPVLDENARLRQEIEQLKAEIKKLKKAAG